MEMTAYENENFFKSYTDQRLPVMLIALWVNSTEKKSRFNE